MQAPRKIAVAGATGRVGRHVVDVLRAGGHDVVEMSRSQGVDVITGDGLDEALTGVECVVDAATGPESDQAAATEFFTTASRNLRDAGARAGVQRMVVVSIIGCDRFSGGYNVAKVVQEHAALASPIPARILRAAQFHEFVAQLLDWTRNGDVAHLPRMRTQLVAARTVGEALAELALAPATEAPILEIAGPRAESLAEMVRLLAEHRGDPVRVEEVSDPSDPDSALFADGGLLPGPGARLAGPTFEEWLATSRAT